MKKPLILTAVALIVLFGGLFGFDYYRKAQAGMAFASFQPPPVQVVATRVQVGEVPRTLAGIGTLEALRQVTIAPEIGGRITKLHFEPGVKVRAGEPLVQINDGPEQGDLQRLRAQAKLAKINLERAQKLVKLAVSQSELDAREAAVEEVQAEIAKTEALIAQKLISAPFSGVLGVRQVHLGQYVNPGDALVTLTDLSALYLNLTVPEQNSVQLKVGQSVKFSVDAHPGRTFSAKVIAIEPQIGVDTRSIKLQARLDNKDNLLSPGMFANANLVLPPAADVITVPETAIDYTIHGDSVFVVRRAESNPQQGQTQQGQPAQGQQPKLTATRALVKTGERVGDRVVIREGLKAGDLIVTVGQLKLQDGAAVELVANKTLDTAAQRQDNRLQ